MLYGCDNAADIGGPWGCAWHKLALGIYKTVGGKAAYLQITLDGTLLFTRQVVVDGIVGIEMVLDDKGAPRVLGTVVAEIEIYHRLTFQRFLQGGHMLHLPATRTAPSSPYIHIDDVSSKRGCDALEELLSVGDFLQLFIRHP